MIHWRDKKFQAPSDSLGAPGHGVSMGLSGCVQRALTVRLQMSYPQGEGHDLRDYSSVR